MTLIFDKLKYTEFQHIYNYFAVLYNLLMLHPPKNEKSLNNIKTFWKQKINPMKDLYRTKNAIYNIIIKIKNLLNNFIFINKTNAKDILTNIVVEKDKEENSYSILSSDYTKLKTLQKQEYSLQMNMTLDYKKQLSTSYFKYEDELKDINIYYKNEKVQYISIDLLIKKLCEENYFNMEIYVNQEKNQTYNFINAFIYQSFGFIEYEILINKLLEAHKYYKNHNKLTPKINNRLLHLIFKITKYLWDHENYKCSYFQSSKELTKNLKLFLTNNNMQEQVKQLIDYKKDNENQIDFSKKDIKDNEVSENSFSNYPKSGFEFNLLKYNEKDIALIISSISIKNFKNLYEHLYELNPTIKNKEEDKPHLSAIADFSNKLTNFFIEEVFSYDLLNTRVNIVEKIIRILIELRTLNNFNDLFSVYSALISISFRLPKTWNQIDSKLKSKLNEFNNLCAIQENYKNVREEQFKCYNEKKFYIPLINITTKHIHFYDEKCKYVGKNGLICVEKIIVNKNEIEEFKNEIRPLKRKNRINNIIKNNNDLKELKIIFGNINPKNLDDLENISQKLEPEFTLYKAPDTRKRKTKTDLFINSNKFLFQVKYN